MEIFRVTFFGHRQIVEDREIERKLLPLLCDLLREKEYVEFYVGRNGEFDELCARLVRTAKKQVRDDNSALILTLPYAVKDIPFYEEYYDDIIIPDTCAKAHPKGAIALRNRFMIDSADLIFCFVCRPGGAMNAVRYAEIHSKTVFHLEKTEEDPDILCKKL